MRLNQTELFKGISERGCKKMEKCLHLHVIAYKKGETVCHYGGGSNRIGIVLTGRAAIYRTDYNGYESLLENLPAGSAFSESMSYSINAGDSILVRCAVSTEIAYLDYDRIRTCPDECKTPCAENVRLRENLIDLLASRAQKLSERVEVLGCHSIREKLLCFFRLRLNGKETGKFELPFTWAELATYVNTDRSAMMREISLMKNEGLISYSRYTVRVLQKYSKEKTQKSGKADKTAKH